MHGMIGQDAVEVQRVIRRQSDWTLKEHEVVVSHWPDVSTIRMRLPHRTKRAIHAFANKCNLTTARHIWTAAEDSKLRKLAAAGYQRKDIAMELGRTVQQVAGRLSYCKISIAKRPPAPSNNPLVDAIRRRAFEMNITLSDLDRSLGDRKIFQQSAGRQRVKHIHIQRAVKALGGTLTVEWGEQ